MGPHISTLETNLSLKKTLILCLLNINKYLLTKYNEDSLFKKSKLWKVGENSAKRCKLTAFEIFKKILYKYINGSHRKDLNFALYTFLITFIIPLFFKKEKRATPLESGFVFPKKKPL